ncbi:sensor domain-containing diguanylate cyclase [Roseovarius faecimaris]|uniref:diguanylate cyclase n=1 Tax=Roseovarius faecimaris TaxID=2494550 RepID=A0A6I6IVC9_9RHOB|nr:diguanylate cyclase [Roseovarius faecimaris]QGX99467.1 sensor domain-containing diguanylate cyclase [Roseovarius faecimaris]
MSSGERERPDPARSEAIAKTAQVFGELKEAVILADTDRRITWVNQAFTELMGYTLDDLRGRKTEILYDRTRDNAQIGRTRHYTSRAPVKPDYMVNYRHKAGRLIRSETIGWAVRDKAGEVIGFAALIRDMDELLDLHDVMSRLYDVSSSQDMSGQEKIHAIMRIGCEYFRLPTAMVTQVQGGQCTVLHAQSTIVDLSAGMQFALSDMFCGLALSEDGPLTIADAHRGGFPALGCIAGLNQRCYIGIPLTVDKERFGTLSFSSPIARSAFSAEEVDLIKLFAAWVAQEIAITRACEELSRAASTDWLTRAASRRQFQPDLEAALVEYCTSGRQASLLMIDIDHFKQINDRFGHAAGDMALRELAERLRRLLPFGGRLYRIGGEEFACLLPDHAVGEARELALQMREAVARMRLHQPGGDLRFTVSLGIAALHRGLTVPDAWLSEADAALYAAKTAGRNRVACAGTDQVRDMFGPGRTSASRRLKLVGTRGA